MKRIMRCLGALILLMAVMTSCKKEVSKITYEGGTAPVLTATPTSNIPLSLAGADLHAITFKWTNPNYQFSTGLSSQNVFYTLQVDTVGAYFSSPKMAEVSVLSNLQLDLTVGELNDIIVSAAKLSLQPNVPHNLEVRIKSTLTNGSVPLFSDPIKLLNIVPYPDPNVPTLWITGDATPSGWTNSPPPTQKFDYLGNLVFELVIHFEPGLQYKFLTKPNQWQPQWGGCGAAGGPLSVNPGGGTDPAGIPTPAAAGDYKITVDLTPSNPHCTVVLQ